MDGSETAPPATESPDPAAREAAEAAAELAAAWAADPGACAALLRYRAAKEQAKEQAPDSCAVLEKMQVSYAAYGALQRCDPDAVERFARAEARYREAASGLGSAAS
jgi:hypothetical protein